MAGPMRERGEPGTTPAVALAIFVHVLLFAVLFFGLRWQTRKPEPISAELWRAVPTPVVEVPKVAPPPPPPEPPKEVRPVEPPPAPKPAPVAEPKPVPKPDIAIQQEKEKKQKDAREREEKAKQEKLAKEREEKLAKERDQTLEKARQEKQAKEREEKLADVRRSADEELRREQARDLEQSRAKAERERQEAAARSAAAQAETQARMAWYDRIRSKVRSNVVVPDNIAGNPEAVFDVVLLPTGQILSATLRKSSGNKLYDEAIERALTKSSPLPLPDKQELFVRNLPPMRFTPKE